MFNTVCSDLLTQFKKVYAGLCQSTKGMLWRLYQYNW